jgi:hypothetical protein
MIKKRTIAYVIFSLLLCYIVSPWFFEKKLLFNEILAISGIGFLFYKRLRVGNDPITICIILLLLWGFIHALVSIFRMDSLYYYLRNSVILYSIFAFFTGYYCLPYLPRYIQKIRQLLRWYIGVFLLVPLPRLFFERFGMAALFPALFKKPGRWTLVLLVLINIIYGLSYDSATAFLISAMYLFLLVSPGYRFFKQVTGIMLICFIIFFISVQSNLSLISKHYNYYSDKAIHEVMNSNRLLRIDGNSTWRLVLWKEVLVDHFPANLLGIGLGTPMMKYFPVEDYSKLGSLPYIIGAHNSFIYLFGRLGFVFPLLMGIIYIRIFKEYFYHKSYYYSTRFILIFWSFFAFTMIALFNPALESPIYASGYWLLLGFTARVIQNRNMQSAVSGKPDENVIDPKPAYCNT